MTSTDTLVAHLQAEIGRGRTELATREVLMIAEFMQQCEKGSKSMVGIGIYRYDGTDHAQSKSEERYRQGFIAVADNRGGKG